MNHLVQSVENIAQIASKYSSKSRNCGVLERLTRRLLDLLREALTILNKAGPAPTESIITELDWQLRNLKGLVLELGSQPSIYRTLTAVRTRARCLQVCRSIGLSLEGLKSIWDQLDSMDESDHQALENLNQLASAFQHAEFPLQRIDVLFFQESEHINQQIFDGEINQFEGLQQLREVIEGVVDLGKIKGDFKSLGILLNREIDRSRCRGDLQEEHSLRMVLWALSGGSKLSPPPEFLCPISLKIMQEPVILCESEITFEKKEILSWFAKEEIKRCPISLKKLRNTTLAENKALKSLIQDWKRNQSTAEIQKSEILKHPSRNGLLTENLVAQNHLLIDSLSCHGSDLSSRSSGSLTAQVQLQEIISKMLKAAEIGNLEILKDATAQGINLNEENENGENCMNIACIHGHSEIVEYLLQHNFSPNETSKVLDFECFLEVVYLRGILCLR